MSQRYEQIGTGYATARRPDPRVAAQIRAAIGDAARVVNVGAGTGNYEPLDLDVLAVEPSPTMMLQRARDAAPCVRAAAEALPLRDDAFDVAMATLTVHHWTDRVAGLRELRRVAPRQVIMYFEPALTEQAWVLAYWPEVLDLPTEIDPPDEAFFRSHLDVREIQVVPVAHDCTDGFALAYWRRPEAYLDPGVQAGMSSLAQLTAAQRAAGATRLADALASGEWRRRFGHLEALDALDCGYRLVIAG